MNTIAKEQIEKEFPDYVVMFEKRCNFVMCITKDSYT